MSGMAETPPSAGARDRVGRVAEHYGVPYGTVRRAMEGLRERGLITTIHGRGTFVALRATRPDPRIWS
jgi:GntR family transcriptional regulator